MNGVKIELYYNDKPYSITQNEFDRGHVNTICLGMQNKYRDFADRINKEGAYCRIDLSHSERPDKEVDFHAYCVNISDELAKILP